MTKTTVGAIIEDNGKILLTKRYIEPFKDYWCLPGGHIDFGETAKQAIVREIKEETDLDITPVFFNYYDEIHKDINWHAVALLFTAKATGELNYDKKEVKEAGWFTMDEISGLNLAFNHKEAIDDYAKTKTMA